MNTDWSSITWEYSRSTITSKCHHIWSIDGQWTHRTVCGLNIQSTVPKEIIHSSITTGIKCLFPQVLSVQHNQSALNKKAAENLWTERHIYSWSGMWAIRTSCCAARQSAAETLFGLSWVGPCRHLRGRCYKSIIGSIFTARGIQNRIDSNNVLTMLLISTISGLNLSRWMFKTVVSTQALSVFLQSSTQPSDTWNSDGNCE